MTGTRRFIAGIVSTIAALAAAPPANVSAATPAVSVTTYSTGSDTFPGPIAFDRARGFVYTAFSEIGQVGVLTVSTGQVLDVPVRGIPVALAVDASNGRTYVAGAVGNTGNGSAEGVTVLRGTRVVATIRFAAGTDPNAVVVDSHTKRVYVAEAGSDRVAVIKGTKRVGTIKVGRGPTALALNQKTQDLYVADHRSDDVAVIHRGRVIGRPRVAKHPVALAVNPVTNRTYVVCRQDHRVNILHGIRRIATVPTPNHSLPSSITVLPAANEVYIGEQGTDQDGDDYDTYLASGYSLIRGVKLLHHQGLPARDTVVAVGADLKNSYGLIGIFGGSSMLVRGTSQTITLPYSGGGPAIPDAGDGLWSTNGYADIEHVSFAAAARPS